MYTKKLSVSLIDRLAAIPLVVINAISSSIVRNHHFFFSLLATLIFYLPSLKNGSINAGFLYSGDILGWYLPALAKTHSLIHSFNFTAIDYSSFNGSSDFFLSPNFFAYHPLVVIYSIFVSPEKTGIHDLGRFLVVLMALHSFFACYFSSKLFYKFYEFHVGQAALVGIVFAFSMHMVSALGQPPFFLCASVVPWVTYAALSYVERPNARNLILGFLPIIMCFLGGYLPLGVASLGLSAILVAAKIFFVDGVEVDRNERIRALCLAMFPFFGASIIVSPYLYSVYKFHHETSSSSVVDLFYAAHQMAQLPQNLLNIISTQLVVPGKIFEFPLAAGLIFIVIGAIFSLSFKTASSLHRSQLQIFKLSVTVYFATVLAIFGDISVVSDLVFYLVPQVGGMHLYERFLLPAHIVFGIIFAIMLRAVIQERPILAIRISVGVLALLTFFSACIVAYCPELTSELQLNNFLVFELFVSLLFACTLLMQGRNFIYFAAIILVSLPNLDRMYDFSLRDNKFEVQRKIKPFALDENTKNKIITYLKGHSNKNVIKYVDITPMWSPGGVFIAGAYEMFPKVFPDYVLNELKLSSYGGFTFYLSARADYMRRMPVVGSEVMVSPDWEYIKNSGADFLIARKVDLQIAGLEPLLRKADDEDVLALPNDVLVIPLQGVADTALKSDGGLFDNGYFRISAKNPDPTANLVNIARGKLARQSSSAGLGAELAVDGNTNGNVAYGSVSHTTRDLNAWLEIDLGEISDISAVTVWNRTDCCGYCLNNYWLFISNIPFNDRDKAADLSARSEVWSRQNFAPNPKQTIVTNGVRGRYVRVQLPGDTAKVKECFLSLAEVEVFRTPKPLGLGAVAQSSTQSSVKVNNFTNNFANFMRFEFEASAPVTIQYLFWDNPRLRYYLNGRRVKLVQKDGLFGIDVPAGKGTFEVRYRHRPLMLFWFFYCAYALAFFLVLIPGKAKERIIRVLAELRKRIGRTVKTAGQ